MVYTEDRKDLIDQLAVELGIDGEIPDKTKVYTEQSGGLKVQSNIEENLAVKEIPVTKPSGLEENVGNIKLGELKVQGVTDTLEVTI